MSTCIIVSAGEFTPENLHKGPEDIIIAADNGLSYLDAMGIQPDYLIGDYDSLDPAEKPELDTFRRMFPGRERTLPKAKDDTDTMAAVRWGFELGYTDFRLYGALGGLRVDHSISNLQTLMFILRRGGHGVILSARQEVFLLRDASCDCEAGREGMFSLFAVDPAIRVTIRGMMFECENLEITYDYPIGCSNEFLPEQAAHIEVRGGTALIVAYRGRWRAHGIRPPHQRGEAPVDRHGDDRLYRTQPMHRRGEDRTLVMTQV